MLIEIGTLNSRGTKLTIWLSKEEKERLVLVLENRYEHGTATTEDILKGKMELDAVEAAWRAAIASERNARYMLWSTIFAALSAFAAMGSAIISLLAH